MYWRYRIAKIGWLFIFLGALRAQDDISSTHVVDCGENKAVPFDETLAPDGRWVIGWTIVVRHQNATAIDWSQWKADDPSSLVYRYIADPDETAADQDDYAIADCVIDLRNKSILILPGNHPYFPNRNHSYMDVSWSQSDAGRRYALVNNIARFNTANMWLVSIDPNGAHQIDLVKTFQDAVAPIIREKRPLTSGNYLTLYSLGGIDRSVKKSCFSGNTATISFDSEVPKSDSASPVEGDITIRLPDGAITRAWSDDPGEDPMQDTPALAEADRQLNRVYQQLQKRLSPAERSDLRAEQLAWIKQRNEDAVVAQEDATRASDEAAVAEQNPAVIPSTAPLGAGDRSLLNSTQKRLAQLTTRLSLTH